MIRTPPVQYTRLFGEILLFGEYNTKKFQND